MRLSEWRTAELRPRYAQETAANEAYSCTKGQTLVRGVRSRVFVAYTLIVTMAGAYRPGNCAAAR